MKSSPYSTPRTVELLKKAVFRTNPRYEIVPLDQIPDSTGMVVSDVQIADTYGVLNPVEVLASSKRTGLNVRVIDCTTALLLLTLRTPGLLPAYLRATIVPENADEVIRLLFDAAIEVQDKEGHWRSGATALRVLLRSSDLLGLSDSLPSRLAQISRDALIYVQDFPTEGSRDIATRLYLYNHAPDTAKWRDILPTREAVSTFLRLPSESHDSSSSLSNEERATLFQSWEVSHPKPEDWWYYFQNRNYKQERSASEWTYKLYISPTCEFVPDTLEALLRVLPKHNPLSFKVGIDRDGLLRPDKIVAYFHVRANMESAARELAIELIGTPPQGVPFTAELAGDGLLSWGIDPPSGRDSLESAEGSWRGWLTNRLASALLVGRETGESQRSVEPWQFAMERIRLEGVDPTTWIPSEVDWRPIVTA